MAECNCRKKHCCASKEATYKAAGVDIRAGYEAVKRIRTHAQKTHGPEVLANIGSFGSLFALGKDYQDPVLVAGTDGVGTKLKIAFQMDKHETIGLDVVAYCVNDIICQGAKPLFFLDYLAVGKLVPAQAEAIVAGVAQGCQMAGCALVGGETAEMPGFYPEGEYDLAGFAVGVVEREKIIDGSKVACGDQIIGIASTGLQSSGFSLVRKVVADAQLDLQKIYAPFDRPLGEVLLTPTGIYAKVIMELTSRYNLHGIANISGGGLPENLPRAMAKDTRAQVRKGSWPVLPVFSFIAEAGRINEAEMFNTFNMGIAMALIVPPDEAPSVVATLTKLGETAFVIGEVVRGPQGVDLI